MRLKLSTLLLLISSCAIAQPPKKPRILDPPISTAKQTVINDTLLTKFDTTRVQYRVWTGGSYFDYSMYLTRINGYVVTTKKVGKYTSEQPHHRYFDWRWKELRAEELELQLTERVDWRQKE